MTHKFFISHFSGDKYAAQLISDALRRISLYQIQPWFSSDGTGEGGLKPGDIWFNQILSEIGQSKAIISLLTPNSINKPWIYFETGIGRALNNCEIIPVCIGIQNDSIPTPLGFYHCYQLNDYRSLVEFFTKILTLCEIRFDEEMANVVLEKLVSEIPKIEFKKASLNDSSNKDIETIIDNFKSHIDKRFIEVLEKSNYFIQGDNLKINLVDKENIKTKNDAAELSYTIEFSVEFPNLKNNNLFIEIRQNDSFEYLVNSLYFMLKDHVAPITYLEEWVIVEPKTNKHIIIREISDRIPAKSIFKPDSKWKIIKLKKPYSATDSSARIIK